MFKKRSRPKPRTRQVNIEEEEDVPVVGGEEQEQTGEKLDLADIIELRRLRKGREGIDVAKLSKGDVKKKRKRETEVGEETTYGLRPGASHQDNEEEDAEDAEAKARKVVRANNFTQQTNALDVDKHMMAYIEENMKVRRGQNLEEKTEEGPIDPYAELFRLTKQKKDSEKEEGNVTNSLAMLTAIPEVDLGMDTRLKNIEETEKAKRQMSEQRKERSKQSDEAHLSAARFYRPNIKPKSDADIMRDAKLEAMGLRPDDHEDRRHHTERSQMATDEIVMERFKKRMRK